jgi:hypothetical protein
MLGRHHLSRAYAQRYRLATRRRKRQMLDEFYATAPRFSISSATRRVSALFDVPVLAVFTNRPATHSLEGHVLVHIEHI